MEKWQIILDEFLEDYKDKDYVIGAVLGGSYATGNYNENSDIDISIITTDIDYKQRGNVIIDGIMIEYFMNPLSELYNYMEDDYTRKRRLSTASLIGNGKIIFDKTGEIRKLQKDALSYYNIEFKVPDHTTIMCNNYTCWDLMDELKNKASKGENIDLTYYMLLKELVDNYYYKNNLANIPFTKIEKIYRDEEYRKKYHLKNMPPQKFIDLFLKSVDNKSISSINNLYKYVIEKFEITDFILRTEIKYDK